MVDNSLLSKPAGRIERIEQAHRGGGGFGKRAERPEAPARPVSRSPGLNGIHMSRRKGPCEDGNAWAWRRWGSVIGVRSFE